MTTVRRTLFRLVALTFVLMLIPAAAGTAQENPPAKPIDLPCASNVSAQVLGSTLVNDETQHLLQVRVIFEPGGYFTEHTHPGVVVATVESGLFGFTHLGESEMMVNRAATADSEASQEPLPHGEEVALNPGDWFVETGMIHLGVNLSDGQTTVLVTGLIEPGQPLTICADEAATPVH
jgi:hypothetical protein